MPQTESNKRMKFVYMLETLQLMANLGGESEKSANFIYNSGENKSITINEQSITYTVIK